MFSDQTVRRLVVNDLRRRGYVFTHVADNDLVGVDLGNNPLYLTWSEAENLLLSLMVGKPITNEGD